MVRALPVAWDSAYADIVDLRTSAFIFLAS